MSANEDPIVEMVLRLLVEHAGSEPPEDAGGHPSTAVHEEVGRRWQEWANLKRGYELILASRLIEQALADYRARHP